VAISAVAQIAHRVGRDRVEQLSPLQGVEHRRLAGLHDVLRAAHGRGRVADVGGEEFEVAPGGGLAGVGDQGRHERRVGLGREGGRFEGCGELVVMGCHGPYPSTNLMHDKGRYHA
jgi:hypothetical protein